MPCIVKVERPKLTEEERAERMEELKKATADFMRAVERGRSTEDGEGKVYDR